MIEYVTTSAFNRVCRSCCRSRSSRPAMGLVGMKGGPGCRRFLGRRVHLQQSYCRNGWNAVQFRRPKKNSIVVKRGRIRALWRVTHFLCCGFPPPSYQPICILIIRFWAEKWLSPTLRYGSSLACCVRHRRRWLPTRRPKFASRYGRATPCRRTSKSRRPECRR